MWGLQLDDWRVLVNIVKQEMFGDDNQGQQSTDSDGSNSGYVHVQLDTSSFPPNYNVEPQSEGPTLNPTMLQNARTVQADSGQDLGKPALGMIPETREREQPQEQSGGVGTVEGLVKNVENIMNSQKQDDGTSVPVQILRNSLYTTFPPLWFSTPQGVNFIKDAAGDVKDWGVWSYKEAVDMEKQAENYDAVDLTGGWNSSVTPVELGQKVMSL